MTVDLAPSLRIALVVVPGLAPGLLGNLAAAIAIGLGASMPALGGHLLTDAAGITVRSSADRPVPILQATADQIATLVAAALPMPDGGVVVPFPAYARAIHDFAEYQADFAARHIAAAPLDGVGLAGPDRWMRSLTGQLKLLR